MEKCAPPLIAELRRKPPRRIGFPPPAWEVYRALVEFSAQSRDGIHHQTAGVIRDGLMVAPSAHAARE
jgi:hypothetical protein